MPKPYIFSSEQALIASLSSKPTVDSAIKFFSSKVSSIEEVVLTGVTGNTFRAFRNLPISPSFAFRDWAIRRLNATFDQLVTIDSTDDYAAYVHISTLDLCDYWRQATGAEMGYGRGAKLFNLVLKKLACLESVRKKEQERLINLQHVPWDSYTIQGLKEIAPSLNIAKNATMKFVVTPAQYKEFQSVISQIAAKAGVPSIYYDILAWDMGH